MSAGDPIYRYLQVLTEFSQVLSFATAAAFTAAGWNLTFKDAAAGTALSPQPAWEIAHEVDGMHRVSIDAEPDAPWYAAVTVAPGGYTPQLVLLGVGEAYSNSDLASLILSAFGTATSGAVAVTSGRLDDWVEGDIIYRTELVIPQWALDAVGATDLSDGVTLLAGIKKPFPTVESATTQFAILTCTATDVPNRLVKLDDVWNVLLALTTGSERQAYKIDISLKKTTRRITAARFDIDVVWQADNQT